jgi:hypothetical protein
MGFEPITHRGTTTLTIWFPHRSYVKEIRVADASRTAHWAEWAVDAIESSPVESNRLDDVPAKAQTPWPESASELYRPSDRRLLAKSVSTSVDRGCHVVSVTNPYGRIFGPPLWSSGQSSWLQVQRSRFDSRHYHIS